MTQDLYAPAFDVKVHGLILAADVYRHVLSVSYESTLDGADQFTLQLADPDLRLADSAQFTVGNTVEISMGYQGRLEQMILGDITAAQASLSASAPPTLTLTGYDKSQRMRHNTPARMTFKGMNDSVIAALLAVENLLVPVVDPSVLAPRFSIQQTGSDWALLRELADRNGFEVFVRWDKLFFRLPRPQLERVTLEWGRNLLSFQPRLSTAGQAGLIAIRGYDYKLAEAIVAVLPAVALGDDLTAVVDRLGQEFLQQLVALGRRVVSDQPPTDMLDGLALAKAVLQQLLDGLYEGSGSCIGVPHLRAGDTIDVRGVGKRFSGSYRLRQVTHTIDGGGYQTRFEFAPQGGTSLLGSLREKLVEASSPKRQEPIYGVLIGKVENNIDPEGFGRLWLSFPQLSDQNLSNWVRIASPSVGTFFLPDRGTEVLVAFEQGDINRPYVLGALWNSQHGAPETHLDGLNRLRVIHTPAGHEIRFDDTSGVSKLEITSAGGLKIVLDDTPPGTITLSGSAIKLQGTTVEIEGTTSVAIKGPGVRADLTSNNMNVSGG